MKIYNPDIVDESTWKQIEFIFWKEVPLEVILSENGEELSIVDERLIEKFMGGHAFDGLIPNKVETNKYGIEIEGAYWTLPKSETYNINIVFQKPKFNSVQSLTEKKLCRINIIEYTINTIDKQTTIRIE